MRSKRGTLARAGTETNSREARKVDLTSPLGVCTLPYHPRKQIVARHSTRYRRSDNSTFTRRRRLTAGRAGFQVHDVLLLCTIYLFRLATNVQAEFPRKSDPRFYLALLRNSREFSTTLLQAIHSIFWRIQPDAGNSSFYYIIPAV